MFDQIETHLTGPADATFHKTEIESRITAHQAAEKHAARERMVRFGEVANVIVGKIVDRRTVHPAAAARVLRDRDTELDAALPDRFVIIGAVESDRVDVPSGFLPVDPLGCAWNRTL